MADHGRRARVPRHAAVAQVAALARAGSELVRITVDRAEAAAAVPHIRERLDVLGVEAPLIGDFHYNGHTLLKEHPACAASSSATRLLKASASVVCCVS